MPAAAALSRLLIATRNRGKFREYLDLLAGLPLELASLDQVGIEFEVDETGATYEENARLKAEAYAGASGLLTLADDSGLDVDALGGAPGMLSARYGGPGLSDEDRVQLLLKNLAQVPAEARSGRFVCVIALAAPGMPTRTVRETVEGTIAYAPSGQNGFGYDPIFFVPDLGKTMAELPAEQKNTLSHRGKAARAARVLLEQVPRG